MSLGWREGNEAVITKRKEIKKGSHYCRVSERETLVILSRHMTKSFSQKHLSETKILIYYIIKKQSQTNNTGMLSNSTGFKVQNIIYNPV